MIKSAALSLRHAILEKPFDLDDKFCDADDLETSWKKTNISVTFTTFFSALFNIKRSLMLAGPVFNETFLQSPDFVEDDIDTERKNENIKFTKLISLYQIMFYIFHGRKKKNPLHMMTSYAIYDKCKSSVSYRQVQEAKSDLAQYTLIHTDAMWKSSCPHIQFSKDKFTIAALDNFDHQGRSSPTGMNSNYDTMSTLLQVKPDPTSSKPFQSSKFKSEDSFRLGILSSSLSINTTI